MHSDGLDNSHPSSARLIDIGRVGDDLYTFKHALIQDVAYQSLLRSTRQQYHQRIAQALEAQFPETVATQPELVVQHYTAAGCAEQAVVYWQRAGQQASDRSAHVEAISHCTNGIELLKTLPETPARTQHTLTLHVARRQEAKSLELRAAMSLSRLWQQQGKQAEAHALLAPVYGWFTEGFDTADLQGARALLEALVSRDASGLYAPQSASVWWGTCPLACQPLAIHQQGPFRRATATSYRPAGASRP